MPTYSYLCGACGGSFEIEQRISEDPIKKCTLCGKSEARRQIVSGNFILKGGGWYSDGYGSGKSASKSAASGSTSSSSTDSASKSEPAKTETAKTEPAKTETKAAAAE